MRLSMIADWLAQPDRRGGGIMVQRGGCGMVGGVIGTEVKAVCCDGDNGTPWRAQGTREQDRAADACAADHGPIACCGVSLRMKISRPW